MPTLFARRFLIVLIFVWIMLATSCLFLLTLGTDEAWVLNGLRSCLEATTPHLSSQPVVTSGGLFALVNLGLEFIFGSHVAVHRFFSLLCLLLLLAVVSQTRRNGNVSATTRCIAITPLLGLPGTAEVGTTALGTSAAVLLFVLASVLWFRSSKPHPRTIVLSGCLFGLAAATRLELCLFAPALLVASCFRWNGTGRTLGLPRKELVATSIGVGVMFVSVWALRLAACDDVGQKAAGELMHGVVTSRFLMFLDYPRQLNKVLIGQGFAQFGLLVLVSTLPFCIKYDSTEGNGDRIRCHAFLIVTGWFLWCAWLFHARIPHLRYLWPSLVCFAIVAGQVLSDFYAQTRTTRPFHSLMALLIAIAFVFGGTAATFRGFVMGDSDYLSWEWSREMPADYFRRFQHVQDQRAAIDFLSRLPDEDTIACYGQPFIYRYLLHRPIFRLSDYLGLSPRNSQRVHLVISPMVGTYMYLPPRAFNWIEGHCKLEAQFGRYSVYALPERLPLETDFLLPSRTNYIRHPLSEPWFGSRTATSPRSN